jgi:uncharacterized protein
MNANRSPGQLRRILRRFWTLPVLLYRFLVSPLLGSNCIYTPSCSLYAEDAILKHGLVKGFVLAVTRIGRCAGGLYTGGDDPVPDEVSWSGIRGRYREFRIRKKQ